MNIAILLPLLAFVSGAITAFQPLINAQLNRHLDSAIWASFVSFAVGTVFLFIAGYVVTGRFMNIDMEGIKWWMWTGGLLGAFFVTVSIYVVPHLGVAALIALLIAGQLLAAALLDHFGVMSETAHPITWQKFAGMVLLAVGAIITLKA